MYFIRRNLSKCHQDVKISPYLTIVRPLLEYAGCIWDPHQEYLIYEIEKIQRRAARWALSDYNRYSSVTEILICLDGQHWKVEGIISRLTENNASSYPCHTSVAILSAYTISNKTPPPAPFYITSYIHYCLTVKLFSENYQTMEQFTR